MRITLLGNLLKIIQKSIKPIFYCPEKIKHDDFPESEESAEVTRNLPIFRAGIQVFLFFTLVTLRNLEPYLEGVGNIPTFSCIDSVFTECGVEAVNCVPFNRTEPFFVYCPAFCSGYRTFSPIFVGQEVSQFASFVVGSGNQYRADSWVCQSAVHEGLIKNSIGGVVGISFREKLTNDYIGESRNSISSFTFNSSYPSSMSFSSPQTTPKYAFEKSYIAMPILFISFCIYPFLAPSYYEFYYTVSVWIYWYWLLFSVDTATSQEEVVEAAASFIPYMTSMYVIYNTCISRLKISPSRFPFHFAVLYHFGLLLGLYFDFIFTFLPPILTISLSSDMFRAGGASVFLLFFLLMLILSLVCRFIYLHRMQHTLVPLLIGYAVVWPLYFLTAFAVLQSSIHLHHYMSAVLLLPAVNIRTRMSFFLSALLIGWFSQGVIKYNFDSPFQTSLSARNSMGFTLGSGSPKWILNSSEIIANQSISWDAAEVFEKIVSFSLFLNDIEIYRGVKSRWNFSDQNLFVLNPDMQYYFRVAGIDGRSTRTDYSGVVKVNFGNGNFEETPPFKF